MPEEYMAESLIGGPRLPSTNLLDEPYYYKTATSPGLLKARTPLIHSLIYRPSTTTDKPLSRFRGKTTTTMSSEYTTVKIPTFNEGRYIPLLTQFPKIPRF